MNLLMCSSRVANPAQLNPTYFCLQVQDALKNYSKKHRKHTILNLLRKCGLTDVFKRYLMLNDLNMGVQVRHHAYSHAIKACA